VAGVCAGGGETMNATQTARLLAMVGKKTMKACTECGAVMLVRKNRHDNSFFLGCGNYPDCHHTEQVTEELYMELSGQKRMFA
jgi:ssDNA-binding Zn-finger/Zn-ribbon topoisomerase 1